LLRTPRAGSATSPMAHIHEKIDFTVALFVVRGTEVLLVHHRKLNRWLPLGGHIELDEDPETAALREVPGHPSNHGDARAHRTDLLGQARGRRPGVRERRTS
jgi:hypothetical protein